MKRTQCEEQGCPFGENLTDCMFLMEGFSNPYCDLKEKLGNYPDESTGKTSVCITNVDGDGKFEIIIYGHDGDKLLTMKVDKFAIDLCP